MKSSLTLVIFALATLTAHSQNLILQSDKLVKKWETPATLLTPESVCYDPTAGILYVSNINGKSLEKDENGFISKLSLDGKITELRWVSGLNAPKGMGIFKGKLFVTDIDRVARIDLASGTIEKFFDFPGSQYLNDIAVDKNGAVYISDMMASRIYRITGDSSETWLDDPMLTSPNGLFVDNDKLMIGCQKILSADLKDKKLQLWLDKTGGIDGLEAVGDGRYLFSDWTGNVYLVDKNKKIEKILDTTPSKINAADIKYIPEKKLLLIPTFGDNRVMAYELKN